MYGASPRPSILTVWQPRISFRESATIAAIVALLIAAPFIVFWPQIAGHGTFIGDSDRLNSFLNIRLIEYDSIKQYGRMVDWDQGMFAGFSLAALHWMNVD